MTEGEDMLPCPFCGGDATLRDDHPDPKACRWVECQNCGVEHTTFVSSAEAIAAWNTRTPTATPSDEVVERVARAIYGEWWDWADLDGSIRSDDMKEVARAAIAALSAIEGEKK